MVRGAPSTPLLGTRGPMPVRARANHFSWYPVVIISWCFLRLSGRLRPRCPFCTGRISSSRSLTLGPQNGPQNGPKMDPKWTQQIRNLASVKPQLYTSEISDLLGPFGVHFRSILKSNDLTGSSRSLGQTRDWLELLTRTCAIRVFSAFSSRVELSKVPN